MNIFAVGDSLIAGVGAARGGWVQLLQGDREYDVQIDGRSGITSTALLKAYSSYRADESIDVVLLSIGVNDSRLRPSMGRAETLLDQFASNIKELLSILGNGMNVGVMGLPRVDENRTTPYRPDKYYLNAFVEQYDEALRATVESHGAAYVDIPLFKGNTPYLSDGLHPSDLGYEVIYRRVLRFLANIH